MKNIFLLITLLMFAVNSQTFSQTKNKKKGKKINNKSNTQGYKKTNDEYYNGYKIYIFSKGGRYYINKKGNKIHIK